MATSAARLLAQVHLLRLLQEMALEGVEAESIRVEERGTGVRALLMVWPDGAPMPLSRETNGHLEAPHNSCERDILQTLSEMEPGSRLTGQQIMSELEVRQRIHGESTIRQALSRLVRVGLLANPHDRLGYSLPALETYQQESE